MTPQSRGLAVDMSDEGRLPRMTATQALRALQRAGWFITRQSGSHAILHHPTKAGRVTIPMHRTRTLRPATLASILDQAGLTAEDLRHLL